MDVNGTRVTATLDDNKTARDFLSLLTLTLTREDYNDREDQQLAEEAVNEGRSRRNRSVGRGYTYYSPWGNVAFFYRDFGYSRGLVKLGRLDSRLDVFDRPETVRVSIGRLDE